MGSGTIPIKQSSNPILSTSGLTRWMSMAHLHSQYFWLLVYPRHLSVDYSAACIPLVTSLLEPRNLLSFLFYIGIAFFLLYCIIFAIRSYREPLLSFCWLVLPFIPSSNIFSSPSYVIAERILYLPSMGFCFLLSWLLHTMKAKQLLCKNVLVSLCLVVLLAYGAGTLQRNPDWHSDDTLFTSALGVCPNSGKALYNVGISRERNKEWELAFTYYQKAVNISKDYDHAVARLGIPLFRCYRSDDIHRETEYEERGLQGRSGKLWAHSGRGEGCWQSA